MTAHATRIDRDSHDYRAACTCGWSRRAISEREADTLAKVHADEQRGRPTCNCGSTFTDPRRAVEHARIAANATPPAYSHNAAVTATGVRCTCHWEMTAGQALAQELADAHNKAAERHLPEASPHDQRTRLAALRLEAAERIAR